MKNMWIAAGVFAVFASGLLCSFAVKSHADAAVVIKNDGLCGMLGADANGDPIFGGIGQVTTDVTNGNKETLKCKGEGITNLSGSGQSFRDFLCGTFSGLTTDSHATVSASGVGTLTCTVTF